MQSAGTGRRPPGNPLWQTSPPPKIRQKNLKSFTLPNPWNLAKFVNNYPGITIRLHRAAPRQMVLLKKRCAEMKKELPLCCCNLEWMKNAGSSMECHCFLRNVQDLLSDGKTLHERRFGEPFKGPVIQFGSMVEYHLYSEGDQSRHHQFGKKVLPGKFLGYALYGDILEDIEELETMDASEIRARRPNAKEILTSKMRWKLLFPNRRWNSKIVWMRSGCPKIHLCTGSTRRGEDLRDDLRGEWDGSQPTDTMMDDREARNDFLVDRRELPCRPKLIRTISAVFGIN